MRDVKKKLIKRRAIIDKLNEFEKIMHFQNKMKKRLPIGQSRVTFSFSPSETGDEIVPRKEDIEKLGLKRAQERLNIKDFYTNISVIVTGNPTKETLSSLRDQMLAKEIAKRLSKTVNPSIIPDSTIPELEVSNEVIPE